MRRGGSGPACVCRRGGFAIGHGGLGVRVCDLAPGSIDFEAVELARLCDRDVLGVVPTHLAGRVADVDTALAIARRCACATPNSAPMTGYCKI